MYKIFILLWRNITCINLHTFHKIIHYITFIKNCSTFVIHFVLILFIYSFTFKKKKLMKIIIKKKILLEKKNFFHF